MKQNVYFSKQKFNLFYYILIPMILITCLYPKRIYAYSESEYNFNNAIDYTEVLIITSESESDYWPNEIANDIIEKLTENYSDVRYRKEYLNSSTFSSDFDEQSAELLNAKYGNTSLDLVVAIDDESLKFISKYYSMPFLKNVPIVYAGINNASMLSYYPTSTFAGVTKYKNIRTLLNEILDMQPETTGFTVLLDTSISSTWIGNQIKDCIPYFNKSYNFDFITSNHLMDICIELKSKDPSQAIILVGNFSDTSNTPINHDLIVSIIKDYSSSSIYTLNEAYLYSGIIGGSITFSENHSELVYEIIKRVLAGESTNDIPNIYDYTDTLVFDAEQVEANDISRKSIPENSILINDSWKYKGVSSILFLIIIAFLVISIVLLIIEIYKKKSSEIKATTIRNKYIKVVEQDKIKTECFTNFSHEIRTLLNVILSGMQLLKRYKNTNRIVFTKPEDEEIFKSMERNCLRLLKLINNLMDLSKIDSGFYSLNYEVSNIVELIEDITMSSIEYAKANNISLIFDTNEEELYMPVDSEKIERILLNLLSNAIKYTPEGGSIYVTVNCTEANVSVSVKDTGIGIPIEKQEFIFERFAQLTDKNKIYIKGSGIGLSLVHSFVSLLGGTLKLKSEPGKGSEFIFTLPVKKCDINMDDIKSNSHSMHNSTAQLSVEMSDI